MDMMGRAKRRLGFLLAGAVLWANLNACYMAAEQCHIRPEAPSCHEEQDPAPEKGDCCGKTCLFPALDPSPVALFVPLRPLLARLPLPGASLLPADRLAASDIHELGPPGHGSPPLEYSSGRSPPLS